jgi:hypothetical protein
MSEEAAITEQDRRNALVCIDCRMCRYARRKQKGILFWFVKVLEGGLCPKCKAFAKVTGRQPHDPLPEEEAAQLRAEIEAQLGENQA